MFEVHSNEAQDVQSVVGLSGVPLSNRCIRDLVRFSEEETTEALKEIVAFQSYTAIAQACTIHHHNYSMLCQKLAMLDPDSAEHYKALNLAHGKSTFDMVEGRQERRNRR